MKIPILSRWLDNRKFAGELEKLPDDIRRFIRSSLPKFTSFERGLATPSNYLALIREYSGWAYACANRNADAVAANPLRLYRGVPRGSQKIRRSVPVRAVSKATKDRFFSEPKLIPHMNKAVDVEEVLSHPWLNLSTEVNQFLNGFSLRGLTQLYKQVTGNAYWLVPKDQNGVPESIWVMPAQHVRILPDLDKFIKGYVYGAEPSNQEIFEPEDVVHFKYPSVKSMYYGLGPMEASYLAVTLNADFDEFERAVLDNGAVIPFVLGTEEFINDTSIERQRKELMRLHGGFHNAGKFAILHSGLKPLPLAWKPTDINYEKGMSSTMQKIFGIFGVPISKVTENSTRAHAEAANRTYMADTINPLVIDEADMINQNILPCYDEKLFVAPDNPVPEDKEFQLKKQTERQKGGALTINEIREIDGLEPVVDGDTVLVLGTYKPLDKIINPPEPVLPPGFGGDGSDVASESDADDEKSIHQRSHIYKTLTDTTDVDELAKIERDMERAALGWFAATTVIVMPFINQFTTSSVAAYEAATINAWVEVEASGIASLGPQIVRSLNAGGKFGAAQLPAAVSQPIIGPTSAVEWAKQHAAKRITTITKNTEEVVRGIVADGLSTGKTHIKIASEIRGNIGLNKKQWEEMKRFKVGHPDKNGKPTRPIPKRKEIGDLYKKKQRERANMISRTETSQAMNEGSVNTYKQAGIVKVEWNAAPDACAICLPYHGQKFPIDSKPELPFHPNCRCSWLPVTD
ncbi:MAG: phage portal protein [FCB group bacterium]|nr:phage portal protein [FCB group bacterium]